MACANPNKSDVKLDPKAVDKVMEDCCAGPRPHIPNYVGKVAYIMGPGTYAGHGNSGLFVIVAQDGDRRIDAVPLQVGYGGHEIKRFDLQERVEKSDKGDKLVPPASITQVREDRELVFEWARNQYRWGTAQATGPDGKKQWVESVYHGAVGIAELVVHTFYHQDRELAKILEDLRRSHQYQLDRAVKDAMYRRSYGG